MIEAPATADLFVGQVVHAINNADQRMGCRPAHILAVGTVEPGHTGSALTVFVVGAQRPEIIFHNAHPKPAHPTGLNSAGKSDRRTTWHALTTCPFGRGPQS